MSANAQTKRPLESKKVAIEEEDEIPMAKRRERKPGRKPLETEAKDKRTAQNRAAQRAFRERRERKMKELEDKVESLEMANQQSELETKFLRSQVTNLLSELKRYNPDFSKKRDSLLLDYLSKQRKKANSDNNSETTNSVTNALPNTNFQFEFPWKPDPSKIPSPSSPSTSPSNSTMDTSTCKTSTATDWDGKLDAAGFSATPGNNLNLYQSNSNVTSEFDFDSQFDESVSNFCSKLSMACGTRANPIPKASPISNPSSSDLLHLKEESPDTSERAELLKPRNSIATSSTSHSWNQPSFGQLGFRNDQLFDIDFNGNTFDNDNDNGAKPQDSLNWNMEFPTSNLVCRSMQNPDSSFIDQNIAFPDSDDPLMKILDEEGDSKNAEELDPIQALINEEPSLPLGHEQHSHPQVNIDKQSDASLAYSPSGVITYKDYKTVKDLDPDDLVQDIIPSNDGKLLKCSEVWDRITAHPRYSDLDIDGLCLELRTKAKCSEKGVVVNAEDVQNALLKHMQ